MLTRSSVLGKRGQRESSSSLSTTTTSSKEQLATPDSTPHPKRARKSETLEDGDHNKENIPPFLLTPISVGSLTRATRSLRRTTTELVITPTRSRALRRNASTPSLKSSPVNEISDLRITTPPPTPPAALLPLHTRVRALLRATCNNDQALISGRDSERAIILDFVTRFIDGTAMDDDTSALSLFISGTPGTGKTALVNAILRESSAENQSDVKVVSINCMSLKGLDGLWERMLEDLGDGMKGKASGAKKPKGREAVKNLLSTMSSKCILILDELDHITANTQSLTSIFTLAESVSDTLRMIGIANTHTLTSSATATSFTSSQNVRTIHFAPYTPTQLQSIIETRLASLSAKDTGTDVATGLKKLLPPPAVMLLTKKVAALTGDVRSLFEVLRGAIDLAVAAKTPSDDENPLNVPVASVTPANILAALKAYTPASAPSKSSSAAPSISPSGGNSEIMSKVRNLGLQARLVLLAILLASKRLEAGLSLSISGSATVSTSPRKPSASPMKRTTSLPTSMSSTATPSLETSSLHTYYTNVLSRSEDGIFEPVTRSEFGDLIGVLEGVGIVSLSSSSLPSASPSKAKRSFGRSASFGAGAMGKNGAGTVGEVCLVEGVWGDEILRGLGASDAAPTIDAQDAQQEEVRAIHEREKARLARDVKAVAQRIAAANRKDTFEGALED